MVGVVGLGLSLGQAGGRMDDGRVTDWSWVS